MLKSSALLLLAGSVAALALLCQVGLCAPIDDKMAEGVTALNNEDWDTAIAAFREAINMAPEFVSAHFNLGLALYQKGVQEDDPEALDEAAKCLRRAAELGPRLPGAHYYLGQIYLRRAEYDKAEEEFNKELAIAARADRPDVYEALGRTLMAKRDWVAAIAAFDHALDLDHNFASARYCRAKCYLELKRYDDTAAEVDKLHRIILDYRSTRYRIDVEKAAGRRRAGEITEEELAEDYSRVAKFVEEEAMWPEIFKLQGEAFSRAGRHIDARNAYRNALRDAFGGNPNDLDVQTAIVREMLAEAEERVRYKGDIQDPYRELEEADRMIDDILEINADFAPALNARGVLYTLMDEIYFPDPERGFEPKTFQDAREALTKAIEIYVSAANDPQAHPSLRSVENYAEAERNLGRVALLEWQREGGAPDKLQEAEGHLTKSLQLYADDPLTLAYLAEVKAELGKFDEALKAGRDAVRLAPHMAETHTSYGYALLKAGQPNEAAHEFIQAVDLVPNYVKAWKLLGRAYLDMQSWSAAVRTFHSALEHIPVSGVVRVGAERAEIHYLMGMAYARDNYHQEAIDQFNQALSLNPSYLDAQIALAVSYRHVGRYQASLTALQAAEALQEGLPPEGPLAQIKFERAQTLNEMGRVHAAYVAIQEALKLRPGDPAFTALLEKIRSRLTGVPKTTAQKAGGAPAAEESVPAAPAGEKAGEAQPAAAGER